MSAITATIAGTVRLPQTGSLNIGLKLNARSVAAFRYLDESGAVTITAGQEVYLYVAGVSRFGGTIDHVKRVSFVETDTPNAQEYSISCVGWEQRLDKVYTYDFINSTIPVYSRNFVFSADDTTDELTTEAPHGRSVDDPVRVKAAAGATLPAGLAENTDYYVQSVPSSTALKVSATLGGSAINITDTGTGRFKLLTLTCGEIVHDLITNFAPGEGITHLTANIKTGGVVDKLVCSALKGSEVLDQLASMSGFVWYIDVDKNLFFVPRSLSTAPFELDGITSGNYRNLSREIAREDKFNQAIVRVAETVIPADSEDLVGDTVTREWDLSNPALSILTMKLDGVEVTFGLDDTDSGKQYYWLLGETKIRQDASETILTGSNHLVIEYRRLASDLTFAEDGADVTATASAEGGSGRYQRSFDRTDGTGVVQAYRDALSQIAIYKANAEVVSYESDDEIEPTLADLRPGQLQTITNTYVGVSGTWLIDQVDFSDVDGLWLKASIRAVSGTYLATYVEYFKALVSGGAGSSSASPLAGSTGGSGGMSGAAEDGWVTLSVVAGVITPDCSLGVNQRANIGENVTIAAPINASPGKRIALKLKQTTPGDFTVTWDSAYKPDTLLPSFETGTQSTFHWVINADGNPEMNGMPVTGITV
jgi:hypothetical protein